MDNAIIKSAKAEITGVSGIIIRGKYTFVKIFVELIKLCVDFVIDEEKYVQGTKAVYEKIG